MKYAVTWKIDFEEKKQKQMSFIMRKMIYTLWHTPALKMEWLRQGSFYRLISTV